MYSRVCMNCAEYANKKYDRNPNSQENTKLNFTPCIHVVTFSKCAVRVLSVKQLQNNNLLLQPPLSHKTQLKPNFFISEIN